MRLLSTLLLAVVSLAAATPAPACTCIEPLPPKSALNLADAVFSGQVRSVKPAGDTGLLEVTLDVHALWKGEPSGQKVVYTQDNSAACGFWFSEGGTYLVYAYQTTPEKLQTNLCTRTRSLDRAQEDLQDLGEPVLVGVQQRPWGPWKAGWR